jgi:hypothetical protein
MLRKFLSSRRVIRMISTIPQKRNFVSADAAASPFCVAITLERRIRFLTEKRTRDNSPRVLPLLGYGVRARGKMV